MGNAGIQLPVASYELSLASDPGKSAQCRTKPARPFRRRIELQRNRNSIRFFEFQPRTHFAMKTEIWVSGIEWKAVDR